MYVFVYVCMYVDAPRQYVCMHAGLSQVAEYRSTRAVNPLRGQLCTQASVQLHLYTSGTNNHIPRTHQYKGDPKHPCTLRASLRLSVPK